MPDPLHVRVKPFVPEGLNFLDDEDCVVGLAPLPNKPLQLFSTEYDEVGLG